MELSGSREDGPFLFMEMMKLQFRLAKAYGNPANPDGAYGRTCT